MWRLWHQLFGIHYVAIEFAGGLIARRVRFDLTGRPYVMLYGEFYWLLKSKDRDRDWEGLTFDKEAWVKSLDRPRLSVVPR